MNHDSYCCDVIEGDARIVVSHLDPYLATKFL